MTYTHFNSGDSLRLKHIVCVHWIDVVKLILSRKSESGFYTEKFLENNNNNTICGHVSKFPKAYQIENGWKAIRLIACPIHIHKLYS